jgi:hypothetical protein
VGLERAKAQPWLLVCRHGYGRLPSDVMEKGARGRSSTSGGFCATRHIGFGAGSRDHLLCHLLPATARVSLATCSHLFCRRADQKNRHQEDGDECNGGVNQQRGTPAKIFNQHRRERRKKKTTGGCRHCHDTKGGASAPFEPAHDHRVHRERAACRVTRRGRVPA